jgi:hypothetical protein
MTVYVADALEHVQKLVSVVKIVTVLEEHITEEQLSLVLFFFAQKDSIYRIFIKKFFLFTVGSVCRVKRVHNLVEKFS